MLDRILVPAAALLAAAAFAPQVCASDSSIDTTFGPSSNSTLAGWRRGFAVVGGSNTVDERVVSVKRAPDGGYVLAGSSAGGSAGALIFLIKFRPDGSYDSAFGGNASTGRILKDAYLSSVRDMTIDAQGRILVVGSTPGALGQADFGVVRFKPDGSDDTSFAGDGGTSIAFDYDAAHSRVSDVPGAVTTLPDGSVFVAGTVAEEIDNSPSTVIGVVKLKPDGSPDINYGYGHGLKSFCRAQCSDVSSVARIVYDAPRNRIVIGGDYIESTNNSDWFIVTQDVGTESATTYVYPINLGGNSGYQLAYMRSLAVQADGKILASGWASNQNLESHGVVLRRQANSVSEDSGFGNTSGRGLFVGADDSAIYSDVASDSLGRIVLAGSIGTTRQGLVQRLTSAGTPDTTFTNNGAPGLFTAPASAGAAAYSTQFKRIFLDGGRPVLAGESPDSTSANTDYDLIITRLQADLIFANSFQ